MALSIRSATLACVTALSTLGASLPAHALDADQKKEIGAFIKEYLVENPEIMLEVQDALEKKQYAARNTKAAEAVADNTKAIFGSKYDLAIGNPDGDVTLVEFFDYNCGTASAPWPTWTRSSRGQERPCGAEGVPDPRTGIGRGAQGFQCGETACAEEIS